MLVKALKNLLTPKAEKIETTQDLRNKCLDKDICALLLKGGKQSPKYVKDAIEKLIVEYPKVGFGAVDTSVLYVKGLEAEYMTEFVSGTPRFVVFEKVSGSSDKSKTDSSRLKTSVAVLDSSVGYGPMSNLIGDVVSKKAKMQKVSTLPTIKTRTKKLEEEERAKRQRRTEQQQRKSSGDSSGGGGGGYFQANDGSAEGRRAERERRRAEHRANNPNYKEKTPEEIKEMERQRRIRMEEEAAKWNIAPDDAPDAGDPVDGGGDSSYTMEDSDWDNSDTTIEENDAEDDDDDEDVLDLD